MTRHHEEKLLPFTATQMFDLVADVARYPEFLPWTAAARIRSRVPLNAIPREAGALANGPIAGGTSAGGPIAGDEVMEADLVISFKLFRERFGSRVTLLPAQGRILTEYLDGPFRHLKSVWTFEAAATPGATGQSAVGRSGQPLITPPVELPVQPLVKPALPNGCKVIFDVDFEFRNALLAGVIGLVFNEAMTRVVRAFEARAKALYGVSPTATAQA